MVAPKRSWISADVIFSENFPKQNQSAALIRAIEEKEPLQSSVQSAEKVIQPDSLYPKVSQETISRERRKFALGNLPQIFMTPGRGY